MKRGRRRTARGAGLGVNVCVLALKPQRCLQRGETRAKTLSWTFWACTYTRVLGNLEPSELIQDVRFSGFGLVGEPSSEWNVAVKIEFVGTRM